LISARMRRPVWNPSVAECHPRCPDSSTPPSTSITIELFVVSEIPLGPIAGQRHFEDRHGGKAYTGRERRTKCVKGLIISDRLTTRQRDVFGRRRAIAPRSSDSAFSVRDEGSHSRTGGQNYLRCALHKSESALNVSIDQKMARQGRRNANGRGEKFASNNQFLSVFIAQWVQTIRGQRRMHIARRQAIEKAQNGNG
jgi:hypothetical protein